VSAKRKRFAATLGRDPKGRPFVPVGFDPDEVWGVKPRHLVAGTVNGMGLRGTVEQLGDRRGVILGAAWRRGCGLGPGDKVSVVLFPEGPQRADLAPDVAAALDAEPVAGAFFDGLAQFYRNAYLRWIDATKRRPDVRTARIAEVVEHLKAGRKELDRT
jgi:hypothetical protein